VAVLDADLFGGADGIPADLCAGSDVRVPVVLLTSPAAARPGGHGEAAPSPVVLLLEKPVGADALLRAIRSATGVGPVMAPRG
jgi:hypothetical protein